MNLNSLVLAFALTGLFTNAALGSNCGAKDTLFDGSGSSYLCQDETGASLCVKTGYHSAVDKKGLRIFPADDADSATDIMIFHDPVWHRCLLPSIKACTHATVEANSKSITASRYRAPDVWDARSSKSSVDIDLVSGSGVVNVKRYEVSGDLIEERTIQLRSCR